MLCVFLLHTAACSSLDESRTYVFEALEYYYHECSAIFRYDPYGRTLTTEEYDQEDMRSVRRRAIERAQSAHRWGLVLGTLGRQGNPALADKLEALLEAKGLEYSVVLMSEISPESLSLMPDIEAWIQVACPRCFPSSPSAAPCL